MARLISIATIIGITLMCVLAEEELYSSRYDDIDIMNILTNRKLRLQYHKCFMDIAPCATADAKFFKDIFTEAFITKCKRCTDKQKELMEITTEWYIKNENDEWEALIKKILEDAKKKNADQ